MYLQPIFDSPDIAKQLSTETKYFRNIDSTWKNLISQSKANPNILNFCAREELNSKLTDCIHVLWKII